MSEYLRRVAVIQQDPEQRTALWEDRSCVIIAGPGSGKTFLLTTKVAKLLVERISAPRGVACLTYSNLLARQLEEDLERLGILCQARLFVGTVHSFCLREIIHRYKHLCPDVALPEPFRISSEQDREAGLYKALLYQGINYPAEIDTSTWGQGWRDLEKYLNKYRRQHPYYEEKAYRDDTWGRLDPKYVETLTQIDWSGLARRYTEILLRSSTQSIDFTGIEIIALRMVEQRRLIRNCLEACFPWLAIDEYQDLGYPFHRMISCLLKETEIGIFAIGDPDQCIYEDMQGTKPEYIWELADQIVSRDGSETIRLRRNYRCAQRLLDSSEHILGQSRGYESLYNGGTCWCVECEGDLNSQQQIVVNKILPRLVEDADGPRLSLDEVAILHPWRNSGVNIISGTLDGLGERWSHSLDKDIDYDSRVSRVVDWMEQCARWCIQGWKTGNPSFRDLTPFWIELNSDPRSVGPPGSLFRLGLILFDSLWALRQSEDATEVMFESWFALMLEKLQLDSLVSSFAQINPDDAAEFDKLKQALANGSRLSTWSLPRFAQVARRIQLTTLHSSKGMQFEAVIIVGFDKLEAFESQPSEKTRRLAYVGFTRAKQTVYLLFNQMPKLLGELQMRSPVGSYFLSGEQLGESCQLRLSLST